MPEKVAKTGIKKDGNYIYFIEDGAVWRVPRRQIDDAEREMVVDVGILLEPSFIYFVDRDGDVVRSRRCVDTGSCAAISASTDDPSHEA
jgi:hypothetical protein